MRSVQEDALGLVAGLSSQAKTVWVLTAQTGMGHEASDILMAAARARLVCGDPVPLKGTFLDHYDVAREAPLIPAHGNFGIATGSAVSERDTDS